MLSRMTRYTLLTLSCLALTASARAQAPSGPDLADAQEHAIKAAVQRVAPCVVQIETAMGAELITPTNPRGQTVRKGVGPTTGITIAPDGYVITSAFNFANKPQKIYVSIPGHKDRYIAQIHATDYSRMLTLLKLENFSGMLSVPQPAPRKGVAIGETVLALGRTLDPLPEHLPSVSVGIVSALNRIWGRAVQTDAKVSPANYGGPLVDLQGRVVGVLVPASPMSEDETAGVEWYDAGIGFAVPLEDINAVLPRLVQKEDLRRGLLGIVPKDGDLFNGKPEVGTVAPGSAAERAGIKTGDTILEIDGHAVVRQAQVMHLLGTRYAGDSVTVKIKHPDGQEQTYKDLKLTASLKVVARSWLGVLPMRDDPELGVEVRYVYEQGPAAVAGVKKGDRITKVSVGGNPMTGFTGRLSGRDQLLDFLATVPAGTEMKLELKRKEGGKTDTVTVKLGEVPNTVPDMLPEDASIKKALAPLKTAAPTPQPQAPQPPKPEEPPGGRPNRREPPLQAKPDEKPEKKEDKKDEKPEVGLFQRKSASGDHSYWVYVPEEGRYDPNVAHTLMVWLHPVGKGKDRDVKEIAGFWAPLCDQHHMIIACPQSENDTGWVASEADFLREVVQDMLDHYTIDKRRVVVHGMGVGGQMAFYVGFHARDLVRGVATTGAVLANQPKAPEPARPLSFYVVVGEKDPVAPGAKEGKDKLVELKYPVIFEEVPDLGHQYLSDDHAAEVLEEFVRWLDSLDSI